MRLTTIRTARGTSAARLDPEGIVPIAGFADLGALLRDPEWARLGAAAVLEDRVDSTSGAATVLSFPAPGKVVCVGLNYRAHILEMGRELPAHPTLFAKFADTLTGPGEPVAIPEEDEKVDWEGELAVVVGRTAYRVSPVEARECIAGYTVANDISMRGWQNRTLEWLQGKIWARSTPIGPVMVTPDEFDPDTATITTVVNGDVMQRHEIADMVFPPDSLVSYISTMLPLHPGDLVLTGTPGGIGHARKPPVYLRSGDVVEVTIGGIGVLKTPIV